MGVLDRARHNILPPLHPTPQVGSTSAPLPRLQSITPNASKRTKLPGLGLLSATEWTWLAARNCALGAITRCYPGKLSDRLDPEQHVLMWHVFDRSRGPSLSQVEAQARQDGTVRMYNVAISREDARSSTNWPKDFGWDMRTGQMDQQISYSLIRRLTLAPQSTLTSWSRKASSYVSSGTPTLDEDVQYLVRGQIVDRSPQC